MSTPKPAFPMVLIEAVMADFIMTALPLPALAKRHDLSLSAAADLLESPEFQSLLARVTRLAEQRARTAAVMHRATALIILERDISTCVGDPEFTRKACAVLLRASELELYPDQFRRARRTPRRNPLDAIAQSTLSGSAEPDPDTPPDASPVPNDAPPAPGALDTQGRNQLGDSDAPESLAMKLSAAAGTVHSLPLRKKHGSPDPTRARAKRARD